MSFLEQIQDSVNSLFEYQYSKHALFLLLVVLAVYFYFKRRGTQSGGALETPAHPPALTEAYVTGSSEQPKETMPPTAVVLFYSNRCGHCQVLMPTWDGLSAKYQNNPKVMLDKVDCVADPAAGEQFKIEGYPTIIKLSKTGSQEIYEGPRDAASLEAFINA